MFRITRDPSSGSFIECLSEITVMVLSCPLILRTITVILAKHCIQLPDEIPCDSKRVGTILNIL